ncbi:sortase domain-containing protein [Aeromicrobium marinum]|uniref:sortase domain-containing protein n=1 Tax=Aeromicrobium marinum TaxID=219314 RepID=UPI00068199E5|nr:sortase [Aeromicrobium marinum]
MTTTLEATPADPPPPPRGGNRRRRGRSRTLTVLGLVLILTGLGFLGYVGWQYYGTNIVAERNQAEVKEQIVEDWGQQIDGAAIGLLRVPRFGDDFEVPINESFSDEALTSGVGSYEKGADAGQLGNFVIAGHRVTRGEPFRDFLELEPGDIVEVETRTHLYIYEMRTNGRDITVDFTTSWPLFPVPDPDQRGAEPTEHLLTMLTCSELFHTRDRQVAIGVLVEEREKPVPQAEAAAAPAS